MGRSGRPGDGGIGRGHVVWSVGFQGHHWICSVAVFNFGVCSGSSWVSLIKRFRRDAPFPFAFPFGSIPGPILKSHAAPRTLQRFGGVVATLWVTRRRLRLAGGARLFSLAGEFRVQLGVARWRHHGRRVDHNLWFGFWAALCISCIS